MALIYITGIAGSGKSTALSEIKRRGYEAHDADENLSFWSNKQSGAKLDASDHTLTTDPKFFAEHEWHMDTQGIENLAKEAASKTIFVCGAVVNEAEVWGYFQQVFCLYVNDESLASRLRNRADKDFGKAEHELHHVLGLNEQVEEKYRALDAIIIDATQPTDTIVDEIIANVED